MSFLRGNDNEENICCGIGFIYDDISCTSILPKYTGGFINGQ